MRDFKCFMPKPLAGTVFLEEEEVVEDRLNMLVRGSDVGTGPGLYTWDIKIH